MDDFELLDEAGRILGDVEHKQPAAVPIVQINASTVGTVLTGPVSIENLTLHVGS